MTWFEIEQIAHFIGDLEGALEEWRLNNMQMREKLAELDRVSIRLNSESIQKRPQDPSVRRAVRDLNDHIRLCHQSIRERLTS